MKWLIPLAFILGAQMACADVCTIYSENHKGDPAYLMGTVDGVTVYLGNHINDGEYIAGTFQGNSIFFRSKNGSADLAGTLRGTSVYMSDDSLAYEVRADGIFAPNALVPGENQVASSLNCTTIQAAAGALLLFN